MQNLQFGRTGATMHYYPAYRPRFSDAVSKTLLNNYYILYWQYNQRMDDLGTIKAFPQYWEYMQRFMPVGIGKTDDQGYLRELSYADDPLVYESLRLSMTCVDGRDVYRLTIHPRNRAANRSQLAHKIYHKTMAAFTPNKPLAFMLLPMDLDNALELEIEDLVEFGKQFSGIFLWCGYVQYDNKLIHLPMHSLAWANRLRRMNENIKLALDQYHCDMKPLLEKMLPIIQLRQFLDIYYRFPLYKDQWPREQLLQMQSLLNQCQGHIQQDYMKQNRHHLDTNQYFIRDAQESLLKLLDHDDLAAKQLYERRYLVDCLKQAITPLFHWREDYVGEALAESLQLINLISGYGLGDEYVDKLFEHYCRPIELVANNKGPAASAAKNSFSELLDFSIQLAPSLAANFPGPPSLVVAIINSFAQMYAKQGSYNAASIGQQHLSALLKVTHTVLTLLNGNKPLQSAAWENLVLAMRNGEIKFGQKQLIDLAVQTFQSPQSLILAVSYQGVMRLILLYTLAVRCHDNRDNTLLQLSGVVATGATVTLSANRLIDHYFMATGKRFNNTLGFIGFFAEGLFSLLQAVEEFEKDETAASFGFAVGFVDIIAAFVFVALGSGLLLTTLMATAIITSVMADWYRHNRVSAQKTVLSLLQDLQEKLAAESDHSERVHELFSLFKQIRWRRLSWRALIPLYETGIGRNQREGHFDEALKVLNEFVDLSFFPQQFRVLGGARGKKSWYRAIDDDGGMKSDDAVAALYAYFEEYFRVLYAARNRDAEQLVEVIRWQSGTQYAREFPTPLPSF